MSPSFPIKILCYTGWTFTITLASLAFIYADPEFSQDQTGTSTDKCC